MTVKLNPGIIALIVILSLMVVGSIILAVYAHLRYRNGKVVTDCRKSPTCKNNETCDNKTGKCIPPGEIGGSCYANIQSPAGQIGGMCSRKSPCIKGTCDYISNKCLSPSGEIDGKCNHDSPTQCIQHINENVYCNNNICQKSICNKNSSECDEKTGKCVTI